MRVDTYYSREGMTFYCVFIICLEVVYLVTNYIN